MSDKETVTIELAGVKYRMTSDAGEAHLQRLAEVVNQRLRSLGGRSRTGNPGQLLAVIALELADELTAEQELRSSLEEKTRATVRDAIRRIDERLAEDVAPPGSKASASEGQGPASDGTSSG